MFEDPVDDEDTLTFHGVQLTLRDLNQLVAECLERFGVDDDQTLRIVIKEKLEHLAFKLREMLDDLERREEQGEEDLYD